MAKKRSTLIMFVATLLIFVMLLNLTPLSVSAETTDAKSQLTAGTVTATLLNVRENPLISSSIIGTLKKGAIVTIEEEVKTSAKVSNVWFRISYDGEIGYVSQNYVKLNNTDSKDNNSDPKDDESQIGIVTAMGLNLREKPSTESDIIKVLKHKSLVTVSKVITTSDTVNDTWLKVTIDNVTGYVVQDYIQILENNNDSQKVAIVTADLNLRVNASTSSKVKEILSKGVCVDILDSIITCDQYGKWYKIRSPKGNIGWVAGKYIDDF